MESRENNEASMTIVKILKAAVEQGASDIHLVIGNKPMVRVDGVIDELGGFEVLGADSCKSMVYSLLLDSQRARFESDLELDASFHVPELGLRFRINVFLHKNGVESVIRVIPSHIPSPEILRLTNHMTAMADLPRGLVLVTGPTGAGKTTTVASLVELINLKHRKNIVTIEDPIEFTFQNKKSIIRQREVGPHTHSFSQALRHSLRQDPDVIMVGEMRDLETISLALTAAGTGHLCFATLHTNDAAQTIDRIVDAFPAHQQSQIRVQLADSLQAVISQILLPRKDKVGRVAAREFLIVNPAVSNLIREGKTHMIPNVMDTGAKLGMFSMDRSLGSLVSTGLVSLDEALAQAHNPEAVRSFARSNGSPVYA